MHQTFIYNRLPEDEPSGSKHVEDIKNYNIDLVKVQFVEQFNTQYLYK